MITCNGGGYCEYRFQEGSRVGCKYKEDCEFQRPLNAEKAERCPDRAVELLRLILPMAKGYAHTNNVGNNQAFCDAAEQYLIVNEGKPSISGVEEIAEIINREPLPEEGKKWEWAKKLAHAIKERIG
jgi:hypothetical protein